MISDKDSLISGAIPLKFHLSQNYPNPFKDETRIKYCVALKTRVRIVVLNSAGEALEKIVDETKAPGTYEINFSAFVSPSGEGRVLACGDYRIRMEAGDYYCEKQMELLQ